MSQNWYSLVSSETPLDQGDIITNCPVVSWREGAIEIRGNMEAVRHLSEAIEVTQMDVVVMTQTCDLTQNKVRYVILCPHYALSVYREA